MHLVYNIYGCFRFPAGYKLTVFLLDKVIWFRRENRTTGDQATELFYDPFRTARKVSYLVFAVLHLREKTEHLEIKLQIYSTIHFELLSKYQIQFLLCYFSEKTEQLKIKLQIHSTIHFELLAKYQI